MSDTDYAATSAANEMQEHSAPTRWQRLCQWVLRHVWYVHPGAHLRLNISPSQTYKVLETAAKPSVHRLHLRNVFTRGRRYFIYPREGGGFRMLTTHKVLWHPRRRTSASAVLTADFEPIDESISRLKIRCRIQIFYLLRTFLWPSFMTSMLVFMTWPIVLIVFFIGALYGLSWMAHRYNAALEAYEMMFFIETVLEEFIPEPPRVMAAYSISGDVIIENGFAEEWDKFVEEMQDD